MYIWTEELSVGVKELDEQHQHLFKLINELIALTEAGRRDVQKRGRVLLDGVVNYNLYHIGAEEEYMKKFGCVSQAHMDAHAWYRIKMQNLYQQAQDALTNNSDQMQKALLHFAHFAGEWHMIHIKTADKGYTSCFNEHGLF